MGAVCDLIQLPQKQVYIQEFDDSSQAKNFALDQGWGHRTYFVREEVYFKELSVFPSQHKLKVVVSLSLHE